MLFLIFQLGQDRYALDARELLEILPLAQIKRLPHAPTGIAGLLDYHGVLLPVIDLSALTLGRSAAERISTRMVVVEMANGRRFALIAERANELLQREATDFTEAEVAVDAAPYLGPVTRDARGIVQWITPQKLFSPAVYEALFQQMRAAA
jgi:chemotaxis-related protein WspB